MLWVCNCINFIVRNRGRSVSLQIFFPILKSLCMNQAYAPFIFSKSLFCAAVCVNSFSWLDCLWNLHLTFIQNEHSLLAVLSDSQSETGSNFVQINWPITSNSLNSRYNMGQILTCLNSSFVHYTSAPTESQYSGWARLLTDG